MADYKSALIRRNFPLALTLLDQEIQKNPDDPVLFYNFAVCCAKTQNYKKAIQVLEETIKKYPKFIELDGMYRILIYSLIQIKSFEDAEKLCNERLKVYTDDIYLLSFLASIQEHTLRIQDAINTHKRILRSDPEYTNSLNSLGYLLLIKENPSEEDQKEAIRCIRKVLQKKPDNAAYLDSFGVLLMKSGKKKEAKKAFEKALLLDPTNPILMDRLHKLWSEENHDL
jgi:tetratricopeptide (TPR) repeat protein